MRKAKARDRIQATYLALKDDSPERVTQCPHCGDPTGYYTYAVVSGKATCSYTWEDSDGDNTNMHDSLHYRELKTRRCLNCHRVISKKYFPDET